MEWGGINLYGFLYNTCLAMYDRLGLEPQPRPPSETAACPKDIKDNPTVGKVDNGKYMPGANCHGYACNNWDEFMPDQDGEWLEKEGVNCKSVMSAYKRDGAKEVPENGCCPKGYHKIFVVVSVKPFADFHIYRQDSNGKWSSGFMDESSFASTLPVDAVGKPISDPCKADHDYTKKDPKNRPQGSGMDGLNYTKKCGALCIKSNS